MSNTVTEDSSIAILFVFDSLKLFYEIEENYETFQSLFSEGRAKEGLPFLLKAIQLGEENNINVKEKVLLVGVTFYQLKMFTQVVEYLEQKKNLLLESGIDSPSKLGEYGFLVGDSYSQLGQAVKASEILFRSVEHLEANPHGNIWLLPESYQLLGMALTRLGFNKPSVDVFEKGVQFLERNGEQLGSSSKKFLKLYAELLGRSAAGFLAIGQQEIGAQRTQKALEVWQELEGEAVVRNPNHFNAILTLISLKISAKRFDDAYEELIKLEKALLVLAKSDQDTYAFPLFRTILMEVNCKVQMNQGNINGEFDTISVLEQALETTNQFKNHPTYQKFKQELQIIAQNNK